MDLKILDSWLRDYLDTKATPNQIAEYLSLCGPSIERVIPAGKDFVYNIEVTTNRIDTASVYGIAREAAAILPRFKIAAKLNNIDVKNSKNIFAKKVNYLSASVDKNLCSRFTAVLIKNVNLGPSPDHIVKRLESADVRSINNVVDISNYIMLSLGQPVHTFDYDKIKDSKMILRESKKGEQITTLDGREFKLGGGDIAIEDGSGQLIDLAGIMGGNLSMVDENTKNVLLFVQTYNPERIRRTSMSLAQRTNAATIFEKGTDTELVTPAILQAITLFESICGGETEKNILDINFEPYKGKALSVKSDFIFKRLGIDIPKKDVLTYLNSLYIESSWKGDTLSAKIPSFRAKDLLNSEDLVEEIARIYGYHNLPSKLMDEAMPDRPADKRFKFEENVKNILSGLGASEVYTLSLVSQEMAGDGALKLKNALGADTEYLRTSLLPSLVSAVNENKKNIESFHIYEMANVYLPVKNNLPKEEYILAGSFFGYDYRHAKGVVEALLKRLNIDYSFIAQDAKPFSASKLLLIKVGGKTIGKLGYPENTDILYYEFDIEALFSNAKEISTYKPTPKFPPQIEDITLVFPEKTLIGNVIDAIKKIDSVLNVELKDTFKDNYTFRVWYFSPEKTLTDSEVAGIRDTVLNKLKSEFGASQKS